MNSLKLDENQLIENFEAKLAKNEMIEPKSVPKIIAKY